MPRTVAIRLGSARRSMLPYLAATLASADPRLITEEFQTPVLQNVTAKRQAGHCNSMVERHGNREHFHLHRRRIKCQFVICSQDGQQSPSVWASVMVHALGMDGVPVNLL